MFYVLAVIGVGVAYLLERGAQASPDASGSDPPDGGGSDPIGSFLAGAGLTGIVTGGGSDPSGAGAVAVDDLEVQALGNVLTSELGSGTSDEKAAIAWTVRQRAAARGVTIYGLEAPTGSYGEQGSARPFSTSQEATPAALDFARGVLEQDAGASPWPGARQFFEPGAQDQLFNMGVRYRAGGGTERDTSPQGSDPGDFRGRNYHYDAQSIRDKWTAQGDTMIATVGRLELWSAVKP